MEDGSDGVAKLAVRIFSVIANSGATERNFSDFGNIQTKRRNRLSVEKLHNTNVLRMDIRRQHAQAGLLVSRGKRKLGDDDDTRDAVEKGPADSDDADFAVLATDLMQASDDANVPDSSDPPPVASSTIPAQRRPRRIPRTQIPLKELFDYNYPGNGLDCYWKGGLKNLEKEASDCEQLHIHREGMSAPNPPPTDTIPVTPSQPE